MTKKLISLFLVVVMLSSLCSVFALEDVPEIDMQNVVSLNNIEVDLENLPTLSSEQINTASLPAEISADVTSGYIKYPEIKFRKMVSQWGNCRKEKGILTFNTNLIYAPYECIKYVILHEFTHLLQPNHSSAFYNELAKICPDWKMHRKKLSEISLRDK